MAEVLALQPAESHTPRNKLLLKASVSYFSIEIAFVCEEIARSMKWIGNTYPFWFKLKPDLVESIENPTIRTIARIERNSRVLGS